MINLPVACNKGENKGELFVLHAIDMQFALIAATLYLSK